MKQATEVTIEHFGAATEPVHHTIYYKLQVIWQLSLYLLHLAIGPLGRVQFLWFSGLIQSWDASA